MVSQMTWLHSRSMEPSTISSTPLPGEADGRPACEQRRRKLGQGREHGPLGRRRSSAASCTQVLPPPSHILVAS